MITNEDIPESDDIFDPEDFDNYVNMELSLDRHDYEPEFERFNKIIKDKGGRPIVIAADNPILDTRMYEVEYADGYKTAMRAKRNSKQLIFPSRPRWTTFCIIQCHHRFAYRRHTYHNYINV